MSTTISTYGAPACPYCGQHVLHIGMCSRIKAVEYHENGTVKRVELREAP